MTDKTEPKSNKATNQGARKATPAETNPPTSQQTAAEDPARPEGRSVEQIERDIEATRADMGDTVEALAEKTDVKAQARKQADEVKIAGAGEGDRRKDEGHRDQGRPAREGAGSLPRDRQDRRRPSPAEGA